MTAALSDSGSAPTKANITGVVLAGGRGTRMGGVDKGLQLFNGVALAKHALDRLRPQVGRVMLNANRNLADYESFGFPVWADADEISQLAEPPKLPAPPDLLAQPNFYGPLAGMLAALRHCTTPYLLTVPCDAPLFPADLASRLSAALVLAEADIAVAASPDADGRLHQQSVFCILRSDLLASLTRYIAAGGRKVSDWTARHKCVQVSFDQLADDARAFFNVNTLAALDALSALDGLGELGELQGSAKPLLKSNLSQSNAERTPQS